MSARGKGDILEDRVVTAALAAHGISPWRLESVRLWRQLAAGLALPWWPQPGSPTPWVDAILSQETGSFTARSLHLMLSHEGEHHDGT
jgi:hypothetical protein